MRRLAIASATLVASFGVATAEAQAPRPTLTFDRTCYGEQEVMDFAGEQYTPGGDVVLLFVNNGEIGDVLVTADATGAIAGRVESLDPERFLADGDDRDTIDVTANDQTRQQDGTLERDPLATFGEAEITVARTQARFVPAKPKPGRKLRVQVRGLAEATGAPMYLHYRRGSKSVRVTPLGRLSGACGDLSKRIPRAFGGKPVPAGRYTLYISTARTKPTSGIYFKFPLRVR